jgi:hypothetical protein
MAFTGQGVAMLSSVVNSKQAIDVNIALTRQFALRVGSRPSVEVEVIEEAASTGTHRQLRTVAVDTYRRVRPWRGCLAATVLAMAVSPVVWLFP